jgi:hypothetical protein
MSGSLHHVEYVTSPPEWGPPLYLWDVRRLWKLAEKLPVIEMPVKDIPDIERVGWYGEAENCGRLTVHEVAEHARRISEADLTHPVLMSAEGYLFDGLHRAAKAWMEKRSHILVKRFPVDPPPDREKPIPEWLTSLKAKRQTTGRVR